jgi:mannose-6-phosphate isomerase-like protein (cupin superfamily)
MKYKYSASEARKINKFGVDITIYKEGVSTNNVVYEEVEIGHLEEFYDDVSTHMWFIIEGKGTFVIDDEKVEVSKNDLVVVGPKKRIHYFGKMRMLLCTTPSFNADNEHHVRDVSPNESPYYKAAE